jgi:xanthine dehydrogenase accessory factor
MTPADDFLKFHDRDDTGQMAVDDACATAHGTVPAPGGVPGMTSRILVAVFASPVAGFLLRYGADLGYRGLLVEPDAGRAAGAAITGTQVAEGMPGDLGPDADIVITDHHRDELDTVLRDALAGDSRWIGVMGNPRHPAPYLKGLAALGVTDDEAARIHRPIGLNIGSRTPPEIAIATLAGLLADRNGRPGGFEFAV